MEYQAFPENNYEVVVFNAFQEPVDREFAYHMAQQAGEWHRSLWRCQIRKVPPELRLRLGRQSKNVYDPVTVSMGPYHHGRPELNRAEEFKHLCLNWCARYIKPLKSSFYDIILQKINVIRECYTDVTIVQKYDDCALAKMMLRDACFIINFMENITNFTETNNMKEWYDGLGVAAIYAFTFRDLMLLENQIPFPVLMMVIKLKYHGQDYDGEELIERFLRTGMILDRGDIHKKGKAPPMHLLEACRRVVVETHKTDLNQQLHDQSVSKFRWPKVLTRIKKTDERTEMKALPLTPAAIQMLCVCRSVMDLKAKGIHFSPSSYSLADIRFHSRTYYGQLQLPTRSVSEQTLAILSNMIAYEVSPNFKKMSRPGVLSYVIFMKSLIQSTADVKELQEKGILINRLANLDQVVRVFNEIDTFGLTHIDAFIDVRSKIEKHCSNKAKTWIADLIHSRFNSPWNTIALFAAVFLICLSFVQAYFTIRPLK